MSTIECEHVFRHLETVRWTNDSGNYNTGFFRVDRFYCEKCLFGREVSKSACQRDTPDWYRTGTDQ